MASQLPWAIGHVSLLLALRMLPFAAYAALTRRLGVAQRVGCVAIYLGVLGLRCAVADWQPLAWIAVGILYYMVLSLGAPGLAVLLRTRALSPGAVFVTLAFFALFLPGLLLPFVAEAAFLIVGWELTIKTYSYCMETSHAGAAQPSLARRMFFFFVTPVLVYEPPAPVAPRERVLASGAVRAVQGIAWMLLVSAVLRPQQHALRQAAAGAGAAHLAYVFAVLVTEYLNRIGLADIQIGLMRQAGWSVPERYERPLLAKSPLEFWRRWNTYMRVWLERYIFFPAARGLLRRAGAYGALAAAVVTMLASGVIHDLFRLAGSQALSLKFSVFFASCAATIVLWQAAEWTFARSVRRLPSAPSTSLLTAGVRRASLFALMLALTALWSR